MSTDRRLSLIAGLLYLATFVTSIPALAMKTPFLTHGTEPALAVGGALLEVALAGACIGTAVALYPILRRRAEASALGFVAARTVEAGLILFGVVVLLALTSLPDAAAPTGAVLIELHRWAFLLGPGLIPVINALLLGTVLLRHRLVPRVIPVIGLIGAPLLAASAVATLAGLVDQVSPLAGAAALPIAVWELSIGLWLTFRGIRVESPSRPTPGVPSGT